MIKLFRLCFMIVLLAGFFCNISPNTHAMDVYEEYKGDEKDLFRVNNKGPEGIKELLWFLEPAENGFCRIRTGQKEGKNLYLTMTFRSGEFAYEFGTAHLPFGEGVSAARQFWTLELDENYSYKIRNGNKEDGRFYFLESSKVKVKRSIVCKPNNDEESLQVWKIDPVYDGRPKEVDLPKLDITEVRILGFKGPVYKNGDWYYDQYTTQYATTSYPRESTSPFMLAYPRDVNDIVCAIQFAEQKNKKILARSGGHHYTGKSSGGDDTILLDMFYFNKLNRISDNPALIEVGPSVKLKDLAGQFNNWEITIPHGECPFVNIGGHAQTGGYGHLLRSFGLALDRVQAFDIVLADGRSLPITRPSTSPSTAGERLNQALFRGVLGGNAGSFGIITKYTFKCIVNTEYPDSYGFSKTRTYNGEVFRKLMNEFKKWTEVIEKNEGGEELEGLDLMMTVESKPFPSYIDFINIPLMGVELVDSRGQNTNSKYFRSIVDISKEYPDALDYLLSKFKGDFEEKRTLSNLSHSFVRKWPFVTTDGREFSYPYKKRVNGTLNALNEGFVNAFVKKIDDVVLNEKGIHMVVQMGMGGGVCRAKGNEKMGDLTVTSIPHRGFVYNFVFDIFYEDGLVKRAEQLQEEMRDIMESHHFNSDRKERRYFWGTFDSTDISKSDIRSMYYDDEKQYEELQELKGYVDPKDIFHTELTVQLPKVASLL